MKSESRMAPIYREDFGWCGNLVCPVTKGWEVVRWSKDPGDITGRAELLPYGAAGTEGWEDAPTLTPRQVEHIVHVAHNRKFGRLLKRGVVVR